MPVTLLFTAAQLCMVAKCMEVDRAVTVGEWAMQEVKESTIETLVGCFGAKRAEARALWDGKEEA